MNWCCARGLSWAAAEEVVLLNSSVETCFQGVCLRGRITCQAWSHLNCTFLSSGISNRVGHEMILLIRPVFDSNYYYNDSQAVQSVCQSEPVKWTPSTDKARQSIRVTLAMIAMLRCLHLMQRPRYDLPALLVQWMVVESNPEQRQLSIKLYYYHWCGNSQRWRY